MNNDSRIKNSARNAIVGLGGQGAIVLINFWSRGIFIKFLSVEYLGVNGLFSNVLTILSLAELGVGSAIIYSMYKPIAENDKRKIQALMNLYSRAYKIIGLVIAIVGILITPFIKYMLRIILAAYRDFEERIELVSEKLPAKEIVRRANKTI